MKSLLTDRDSQLVSKISWMMREIKCLGHSALKMKNGK